MVYKAEYHPERISDWEGRSFVTRSGKIYVVKNRTIIGPDILKHSDEKIAFPLFIGGIPRYMSEKELRERRNITAKTLAERAHLILYPVRDCSTKELLTSQNKEGLYETLEKPELGLRLGMGLITIPRQSIVVLCKSGLVDL